MSAFKSLTIIVATLALGGVTMAAPARDDGAKRNISGSDPQVGRAAFYRATTVGECGAVQRPASAQTKRERETTPARGERRETFANTACNVVWSD